MPLRMFQLIQQAKENSQQNMAGNAAPQQSKRPAGGKQGVISNENSGSAPFQGSLANKLGAQGNSLHGSMNILSHENQALSVSQLLNEELKNDEVRKIEKYAQLLGGGDQSCFDWCIVETILY